VLTCRVVDTKRVDAKCRASGGAEQVVADVRPETAIQSTAVSEAPQQGLELLAAWRLNLPGPFSGFWTGQRSPSSGAHRG
jgi:hypothetical protein